jgi:hypothetical protein
MNIELLYQDYLRAGGLNEAKMHPIQKSETKKAFMGGFSSMVKLLREQISEMPEDDGVDALESINEQLKNYWLSIITTK